jgi:hypothetical protein
LAATHSDIQVASLRDGGIYQGMQRGAELATGKYLMFVNSSDLLNGTTLLSNAIEELNAHNWSWGFGPIVESTLRSTLKISGGAGEINLKSIVTRKTFVPFPVVIMEKEKFFSVGGLNFKYKIAGDFDLIVRLVQDSLPVRWEHPLVIFSAGGISYTKPITAWREEHQIRVKNLKLGRVATSLSFVILVKRILRWLAGKLLDSIQLTGIIGKVHWRDRN